jgi:lactoylglutathione lyase
MRLNHLNLTVPEVSKTRAFFETYFGFRLVAEAGGDALVVLTDESGFILTLNNFEKATEVEYPAAFHIGFMQESREQVDAIHARLKSDGFDVKTPKVFHGAWTFYFRARGLPRRGPAPADVTPEARRPCAFGHPASRVDQSRKGALL